MKFAMERCDGYYDKEVGVVNEPNMELQML